jgi:2'-5' RNA ligase
VIWVKVEDAAGQVIHLQQQIQTATQPFTTEAPEEKFTGHVTLGRVKAISRDEGKALAEIAVKMRERVFGEWRSAEVEVMKSELSSEGARYSRVAEISLRRG